MPLETERRGRAPEIPGKDGGGKKIFLRDARAREFAEPESAKTQAKQGDRSDHRAPAGEPSGPPFGAERKGPVGSTLSRSTIDEAWKDRARD